MDNEYYSQENHGPYSMYELGDFELECGKTLPNCQLAYASFGELNEDKTNAVVFTVMFSGTNKAMESYIGKGLALDPEKYFIIVPNQIGSGLSTSPHNAPLPDNGADFPDISIGDDVRAQHQLLTEEFGVKSIELVTGWSMGAQQTYEWCVRYPDLVKRAAPIGGTAKCTPHDSLYVDVFCEALKSDPAWEGGRYTDAHGVELGLKRMAHVFALMGNCTEFYRQQKWEALGIDSLDNYLTGFWETWFKPMDPNNLLCMASKWKHGDVSAFTGKSLEDTLAAIQAKVFVIAFTHDMFIPLGDCQAEQQMIPNSELKEVPTLAGHFGMLGLLDGDFDQINGYLGELLQTAH